MSSNYAITKILVIMFFITFATHDMAQSPECNYVLTRTMLNVTGNRSTTVTNYYDGLGRSVQDCINNGNKKGRRIVTHRALYPDGRTFQLWLPVINNTSDLYTCADSISNLSVSTYGDLYAFSIKTYDTMGRITYTSTAGQSWASKGKGVFTTRLVNTDNSVKYYITDAEGNLKEKGYYKAGTLKCVKKTDEDCHTLEIYSDMTGRKILERRANDNDTYYVYDSLGRLRFVLSPAFQQSLSTNKHAYKYQYDDLGNLLTKTLPGCEETQYFYDNLRRVTFMQDAKLRSKGLYRFFLYDNLGRLAVQGSCTNAGHENVPNIVTFTGDDSKFGGI